MGSQFSLGTRLLPIWERNFLGAAPRSRSERNAIHSSDIGTCCVSPHYHVDDRLEPVRMSGYAGDLSSEQEKALVEVRSCLQILHAVPFYLLPIYT